MINRNQIETILKINGVSSASPDEEIRSVLLSARYKKDEVDTAIMILRENIKTNKTRVEGLHKVFRTDNSLKPNEISRLLGIDVDINETVEVRAKTRKFNTMQFFLVWVLSLVVAVCGILSYMYMQQVGIFHPSVM